MLPLTVHQYLIERQLDLACMDHSICFDALVYKPFNFSKMPVMEQR